MVSFDIFIDNYLTSFGLLTHLELTKFEQQVCSTKIDYANALSLGTNICKKGSWPLWKAHIKQKSSLTLTVVGWNNNSAIYIASSESCEPKRFVWCWKKVEIKYIQEQRPNQFQFYNYNIDFVNTMDQIVTTYLYPHEKIAVVPVCLSGRFRYSRCGGYCIILTKIKVMSLCLFYFFEDMLSM